MAPTFPTYAREVLTAEKFLPTEEDKKSPFNPYPTEMSPRSPCPRDEEKAPINGYPPHLSVPIPPALSPIQIMLSGTSH